MTITHSQKKDILHNFNIITVDIFVSIEFTHVIFKSNELCKK